MEAKPKARLEFGVGLPPSTALADGFNLFPFFLFLFLFFREVVGIFTRGDFMLILQLNFYIL